LALVDFPRSNVKSGPLAGHVRKGRVYRSPLAATGVLHAGDWVRDDLPDMLWPVLVFSELGNPGCYRFQRWQKAVLGDLSGQADAGLVADCLDGRLTSLDRLAAQVPGARSVVRNRAEEFGLLPGSVSDALDSYPVRPAIWLTPGGVKPSGRDEIDILARAVWEVLADGHREAVIKCLWIWSAVLAGTFRSNTETIELLKPYPADPGTRAKADSAVRAMWGARKELTMPSYEVRFPGPVKWAKVFWGANSMTTGCMRRSEAEMDKHDHEEATTVADESAPDGQVVGPGAMPEGGAHLRRFAMDLLSCYVEALETSPARLHDPERQEVVSGLVARAGRDVITALGAPDLWCMEHGAHIARMLVEVRIYVQWMAQQDPSIYPAFQDYGAGKAKLYSRIMDEVPPEARQAGFEEAVGELTTLSRNNKVLDERVVDTSDSFAGGKSIRAMAEECGLLDFYRQVYSIASGVSHSEWWSIETHAMERCLNVLHGGHLIPSMSLNSGGQVEFAKAWVDQLYALMRISLRILETREEAVEFAFAWLEEGQDQGTSADAQGESATETVA